MRNIFDQFQQPENQLTHAFASVLVLSPALCRRFLWWVTGRRVSARDHLHVEQQRVPGAPELLDESEQRSLPDAYICGTGNWCLVIESKVGARLSRNQLDRHRRMAARSFDDVHVLSITAEERPSELPTDVCHRTWTEVFEWLGDSAAVAPSWVDQLREYMRLLESRFLAEGYHMRQSSITSFDGIRFRVDHPYSYREAKLLLHQLMDKLRKRKNLRSLGIDSGLEGRPAITEGAGVWDIISLRPPESKRGFTSWPQLTIFIGTALTRVVVTVPNNIDTTYRKRLVNLGRDGFIDMAQQAERNLTRHVTTRDGFRPVVILSQRHFRGRRSEIQDGSLNFDLRTIRGDRRQHIKAQRDWIGSAFDLFAGRQGNVQLQLGAEFSHKGSYLATVEAPQRIEAVWLACRPLIAAMRG